MPMTISEFDKGNNLAKMRGSLFRIGIASSAGFSLED
jgi:hypothetical protein